MLSLASTTTIAWMVPTPRGTSGRWKEYRRVRDSPDPIGPLPEALASYATDAVLSVIPVVRFVIVTYSRQEPDVARLPAFRSSQRTVRPMLDCSPLSGLSRRFATWRSA